jgi:predicted amidohydrolase
MNTLRLSAVVCHCPVGEKERNLKRMEGWVEKAAGKGAAAICFPEMNVSGYSVRSEIVKIAETVPGETSETLLRLSEKENIVILAGLAELGDDGRVFASHLVIKPSGNVGIYRKLHIAPPEQDLFAPGTGVPLFETHGFTFGVQLCYDAHFPELSTHMALHGADIIFMPHASPRGTPEEKYRSWLRHMPARAFDNGLFIVACNQTGDNGEGLSFPGTAVVIGPSGDVVSETRDGKEGMLIADINAEDLEKVRNHRMRYFLPNRRRDLFPLK